MPTVDQLTAAPAAADTDELVASQSGILRRMTRAQLLTGTQSQITLQGAALLGRQTAGIGAPETINVGAGLTLASGTLSAVIPPVSLAGLDASASVITPDGALSPLRLSTLFASAVCPESFGAVGDGVTDDTVALSAAIATQRPVHLGPRTYATSGQWTIPFSATLTGTAGQSTLRRINQTSGSAWISISGPCFTAEGIIFDANSPSVPGEAWAVLITSSCPNSSFRGCSFRNAGGATLGNGLTVLASDPAIVSHTVDNCEANGNAAHGVWLQAVDGARLTNNRAHDNVGYGLCTDFNDPTFKQAVRLAIISGNTCWNNERGISVGNFNETNLQPPTWGNANPDAICLIVAGNICHDNKIYGITVSGRSLLIQSNLLSNNGSVSNGGAGILANCAYSRVAENTVTGSAQFGIDCGGSQVLDVAANHISAAAVGINPGGSQNVRVMANFLQDNGWAILAYNVETDGGGRNFGRGTNNLSLTDNTVGLSSATGGGIWLIDAPQNVLVARNAFCGTNGASIDQCLYAHTDSAVIEGNTWNATQRIFANPVAIDGLQTVTLPDIADEVMLSAVPSGVQSIRTRRQIATTGQIGFIKITSGGTGYTYASVSIRGAGTGATATAYVADGAVIGIALGNPGSGYGPSGSAATATITGDGVGAAAAVTVGLPVLEGRRIRIACNTATTFTRIGSAPFQENWTLASMTAPANATVAFTGTFGSWRADGSPLADYVAPPGDGSLTLRSQPHGDVALAQPHRAVCVSQRMPILPATSPPSVTGRPTASFPPHQAQTTATSMAGSVKPSGSSGPAATHLDGSLSAERRDRLCSRDQDKFLTKQRSTSPSVRRFALSRTLFACLGSTSLKWTISTTFATTSGSSGGNVSPKKLAGPKRRSPLSRQLSAALSEWSLAL